MIREISKDGIFIPSYNGNKELPPAEQIVIKYRIPTITIKNRCRAKPKATGIANSSGGIDRMEIVIEKDDITAIKEMLISISGCYYRCDGKDHAVATALDLLNAPIIFEPLLKEIAAEFDSVLDRAEIDEKN